MPTVTKQTGKRQHQVTPAHNGQEGSVLGRVIDLAHLKPAPVKVLCYGGNRVGKTTLACQADKPLLLVSFEPAESGGAESVRKVEGVSYVRVVPNNHEALTKRGPRDPIITEIELAELLLDVRQGRTRFLTVVCDGATSAQDVVLANLMDLPKVPDTLGWGTVSGDQYRERSERTKELLRLFVDLPIDTWVLAKEKDHNPPKEERVNERTGKVQPDMRARFLRGLQPSSFVAAELGGATVGWLQDCCDCICRLYVEEEVEIVKGELAGQVHEVLQPTGRYIRKLRTGYHPNYAAGVRSCRPEAVTDVIDNPTVTKLYKVLRGV